MRIEEITRATDYIYQHSNEYIKQGQAKLAEIKKKKGRKDD